ncbi:MAG: arginyl-tRNA synthetase [Marteilia pararefringens]
MKYIDTKEIKMFQDKKLLKQSLKSILRLFRNERILDSITDTLRGKSIAVEYFNVNFCKPIHLGHMRSLAVGRAYRNLLRSAGACVKSISYHGDYGSHMERIMAYMLTKHRKFKSDDRESIDKNFHRIYSEACAANDAALKNELSSLGEEGGMNMCDRQNDHTAELYEQIQNLSMKYINEFLVQYGGYFDITDFESNYCKKAQRICKFLENSNVIQKHLDSGCLYFRKEEKRKDKIILLKSNGDTVYLSRDIAAFLSREESIGFDDIFYTTDSRQKQHFENLKEIIARMGYSESSEKINHLSYGIVKNMSSRKGQFIDDDQYRRAIRTSYNRIKFGKIQRDTGLHKSDIETDKFLRQCIMASLIMPCVTKNIEITEDFIQQSVIQIIRLNYCYLRLNSLLKKFEIDEATFDTMCEEVDIESFFADDNFINALLAIMTFDIVVQRAVASKSINTPINYVSKLLPQINQFHDKVNNNSTHKREDMYRELILLVSFKALLFQSLKIANIEIINF